VGPSQRPPTFLGLVVLAALALPACGPDAANREFIAALQGEETGMGREAQIAHLDRAIAIAPTRSEYYEARAIYRIDLEQFDPARADLDRDIALSNRPYARFLRGLVACQEAEYSRSLADFDAAIAAEPANTQFYRGRSLARAACGDAHGALEDADHLVATAPQQAESFYARGVALGMLGRYPEARADFYRAARIRPELVYVRDATARTDVYLGDDLLAAAHRRVADSLRAERSGCAVCLDPFRY
jgi:tetratricopeptide (TPR) repeat protein